MEIDEAVAKTLKHAELYFSKTQIASWLNWKDENGLCLLHYLVALDLDTAIKSILVSGANIGIKVQESEVTALIIAMARGNEKTQQTLISFGA